MWIIAGLACTTYACVWMVPAFDAGMRFDVQRVCASVASHMEPGPYMVLECRRTDHREGKPLE